MTSPVSRAQASEGSTRGFEQETVEPFPGNRVDFLKTCLCSYSPTSIPESGLVYFLGWFPEMTAPAAPTLLLITSWSSTVHLQERTLLFAYSSLGQDLGYKEKRTLARGRKFGDHRAPQSVPGMKRNLFTEVLRDTVFPYFSSQFTEETLVSLRGYRCNDPVILPSLLTLEKALYGHKGSQRRPVTEKEKPGMTQASIGRGTDQ